MKMREIMDRLEEATRSEGWSPRVGKWAWFEYHCHRAHDSADAEIWYRSHQRVKVIGITDPGIGRTFLQRINDGEPRIYRVRFEDGLEWDVFEDELAGEPWTNPEMGPPPAEEIERERAKRNNITEAAKKIEPVEWPTNLAWRIEFKQFAKVHPLLDIRRGKLYALPFRNWEDTFYKLTLKEATKVKFMDTSVVEVPPDALVGDMRIIDRALAHLTANDPTGARERDAIAAAQPYLEKAVPYSEFVHNPDMFERPEILLDRATTKFLPFKVTIADYVRGEGYRLGLAPKR